MWSYDFALGTDKDRVRFYIGDVTAGDPFLQDEEILVMIGDFGGNLKRAAAECADAIYRRLIKEVNVSSAGFSISAKDRAEGYRVLALRLLAESQVPGGGGLTAEIMLPSLAGDTGAATDPSLEQPFFTRHMQQVQGTSAVTGTAGKTLSPINP